MHPDPHETVCRGAPPEVLWRAGLAVRPRVVLMAILCQLEPGADPPTLRRGPGRLLLPAAAVRRALYALEQEGLVRLEHDARAGEYCITVQWGALAKALGLSIEKVRAA